MTEEGLNSIVESGTVVHLHTRAAALVPPIAGQLAAQKIFQDKEVWGLPTATGVGNGPKDLHPSVTYQRCAAFAGILLVVCVFLGGEGRHPPRLASTVQQADTWLLVNSKGGETKLGDWIGLQKTHSDSAAKCKLEAMHSKASTDASLLSMPNLVKPQDTHCV